jgi:hypothetical protein
MAGHRVSARAVKLFGSSFCFCLGGKHRFLRTRMMELGVNATTRYSGG